MVNCCLNYLMISKLLHTLVPECTPRVAIPDWLARVKPASRVICDMDS